MHPAPGTHRYAQIVLEQVSHSALSRFILQRERAAYRLSQPNGLLHLNEQSSPQQTLVSIAVPFDNCCQNLASMPLWSDSDALALEQNHEHARALRLLPASPPVPHFLQLVFGGHRPHPQILVTTVPLARRSSRLNNVQPLIP